MKDREEMTFVAEDLLDLFTLSASMPYTNNASTQTDLGYTDIDCLVAKCNKARANKLRLRRLLMTKRVNCVKENLIQGSDVKTRFILGYLPLLFHGTPHDYRAIHYSGPPTSQQF